MTTTPPITPSPTSKWARFCAGCKRFRAWSKQPVFRGPYWDEVRARTAAQKRATGQSRTVVGVHGGGVDQIIRTVTGIDPRDLDRKIKSESRRLNKRGYTINDIERQTTSMNFGAHHRATIVASR